VPSPSWCGGRAALSALLAELKEMHGASMSDDEAEDDEAAMHADHVSHGSESAPGSPHAGSAGTASGAEETVRGRSGGSVRRGGRCPKRFARYVPP